jgi:hypothetical protein
VKETKERQKWIKKDKSEKFIQRAKIKNTKGGRKGRNKENFM